MVPDDAGFLVRHGDDGIRDWSVSAVQACALPIADALPASLTFVSAQTTQGTTGTNGNVVTCNVGTLSNGTGDRKSVVEGKSVDLGGRSIIKKKNGVTDFASANNSASVTATVNPVADLAVSKTVATNSVFVGSNLVYTILVTNQGPRTAKGMVVSDSWSAGCSSVLAQTTQGTTGTNGNVVTCNVGTLSNGT